VSGRVRALDALGALVVLSSFVCAACGIFAPPAREAQIEAALADLRAGSFEFDADVRFRADRYAVCEGLACADLVLTRNRRTIILAEEAFGSPSVLRASLLEIWERYREPRPGSVPDLARGALRVVRDGPRVGVVDPHTLRRARNVYRQLWEQLPRRSLEGLPDPDTL
jgi:hypothetical protein